MRSKKSLYVCIVIGLVLICAGGGLQFSALASPENMPGLPFVCIGLGCGMLGGAVGNAVKYRTIRKNPELAREIELQGKDERSVLIRQRAAGRAFFLSLLLHSALLLFLALARVQPYITIAFVAAYIAVIIAYVYYLVKYQREM